MTLDVLASERHFVDHCAPVWALLGPARGRFVVPPELVQHARLRGVDAVTELTDKPRPVLVSSYGDLRRAQRAGRKRIAYLEHGSGQSWGDGYFGPPRSPRLDHESHPGGVRRDGVSLFLHPNEHAAKRERAAYPDARVEVVGSPKVDDLPRREGERGRVVCISFHWNSSAAPEARGSFHHYRRILPSLARTYTLIGHGHPRVIDQLTHQFGWARIPLVRDFEDVCRQADLYVGDSTSTLFEFASTDRPVVVLNAPWYGKRRRHGLRFWDAATVGLQVDRPADLIRTVGAALKDPRVQQARRRAALDLVYPLGPGAAQRAVDVLHDWLAAAPARAAA